MLVHLKQPMTEEEHGTKSKKNQNQNIVQLHNKCAFSWTFELIVNFWYFLCIIFKWGLFNDALK